VFPAFLGSLWLASFPFILDDWILGFSITGSTENYSPSVLPLVHFDATLNVLRSSLPRLITNRLDSNPQSDAPRMDFYSLQHLKLNRPFFRLLRNVQKTLPCFLEVPFSGFGYPLNGVTIFQPWKRLTSNAPRIHSSEPSSSSMVKESFLFFSPLLRFFPRPSGFGPVLQWFSPIKEAVPLLATSKFFEAGSTALLSFQISRVSSSPGPPEKHSFF
jgi:hypothetical protein